MYKTKKWYEGSHWMLDRTMLMLVKAKCYRNPHKIRKYYIERYLRIRGCWRNWRSPNMQWYLCCWLRSGQELLGWEALYLLHGEKMQMQSSLNLRIWVISVKLNTKRGGRKQHIKNCTCWNFGHPHPIINDGSGCTLHAQKGKILIQQN